MKLNGLVLTGGRSSRLGFDKGLIRWHGIPQWQFVAELLSHSCNEVYISGDHINQHNFPALPDRIKGIGPLGGIYSAFKHDPSTSWFVLACDLPLIDTDTTEALLKSHDPENGITCGYNPQRKQAEPLISIWEAGNLDAVENKIQTNDYSIQDLIAKAFRVQVQPQLLTNVNTPEEYFEVRNHLPYVPIDCNYYDVIESAALQASSTLKYYDGDCITERVDKISTTEIRDHTEYVVLASGKKIRMDMISSINGNINPIH